MVDTESSRVMSVSNGESSNVIYEQRERVVEGLLGVRMGPSGC